MSLDHVNNDLHEFTPHPSLPIEILISKGEGRLDIDKDLLHIIWEAKENIGFSSQGRSSANHWRAEIRSDEFPEIFFLGHN